MPNPLLPTLAVALLIAPGLPLAAQTLQWDGGPTGTGTTITTLNNWAPDLLAAADLTDKVLRIATANFDPATVTTSFGIGNVLTGALPQIAGFEFDNAGGYYRLNFGARIVPTTSASFVTDRVITFGTPGTIIKVTNNASASIRRFSTNVGDGTGDIATMIVNLNYVGSGTIFVDATSTFLFQETKITGTGGITKTGPGTLTLDSGFFASLSAPPNLTINTQYAGTTNDTYSGGLNILAGVVSIDSVTRLPSATLNNDGVTPNTDAVIINGGTLRFTGGTLGSSANRGFRVGAATGTFDITAANTRIGGSIRNVPGEDGVLIKTGVGNLSLEGANHTFTGGTRLQGGTLTLNGITLGDIAGQGLQASGGTTLRGNGTINGPATFATGATLQPATYLTNAPTAAVGQINFASSLTLGDVNYVYDLDTPAASDRLSVAAGALLTIGTGLLDLTSFTFTTGTGFGPGVYPLLTSEEIIVGSLGPVLTGTLGGLRISLGLSADQRSVVLTATADTPLETWRKNFFGSTANTGDGADDADPDFDGVANLLEYALGGSPILADGVNTPRGGAPADRVTLTFNRIADPALIYTVQASDTLAAGSWTDIWTSTGVSNVAGPVTVTDPELISAHPRRFLRLAVSY